MVQSERPIIPGSLHSHCQGTETLFDFSATEMFVCLFVTDYTTEKSVNIFYGEGSCLLSLSMIPLLCASICFLWGLLLEEKKLSCECLSSSMLVERQLCFSACLCAFIWDFYFQGMPIIDTTSAGRGPASPSNGKQLCFLTSMINILPPFRQRVGRVNSL